MPQFLGAHLKNRNYNNTIATVIAFSFIAFVDIGMILCLIVRFVFVSALPVSLFMFVTHTRHILLRSTKRKYC